MTEQQAQIEALQQEQHRLRKNLLAQQRVLHILLTLMLKSGILDKETLVEKLKEAELMH